MKSDRLLSLLMMLQSRRQRTASELACALEGSVRTVYRDVESRALAGVPIYTRRGSDGGIALSEGYRRTLTHFDEEEVRALFIASASALADRALGRALDKLRGAMWEAHRRAAEHTRARIMLDQRRWYADDAPRETLAILRRAVWQHAVIGEYDGALRVRVHFPGPEAALYPCIAWGDRARIEEPLEFSSRILATARNIVASYGKRM